MPIQHDEQAEERERQFELQRMAGVERDRAAHRRHEEEKLKLKLALANKQKTAVTRTEGVQRVLIAWAKLPTLPIVLVLIWTLLKREIEVPQYLVEYVNL